MLTGDKGLTAEEIGVSCGLMPAKEDLEGAHIDTLPTQGNAMAAPAAKPKSKVFNISEDHADCLEIYEEVKKFNKEKVNYESY